MNLRTLPYLVALWAVGVACQPSKKEESAEASSDDAMELEDSDAGHTDAAPMAAAASAVANANLASESTLLEKGASGELVAQILAKRPFLTMKDFDLLVSEHMDAESKEIFYGNVFVPFNINTAEEDDFKLIPGVGDRMAHEFEEYRPYSKLSQFRKEIGKYVDEAEVTRFEQYVFVPVELNSASEEDILALPGLGDRMAHEFEEYRPYKDMAQFRKEMGKYVDDAELRRLERLVYLEK